MSKPNKYLFQSERLGFRNWKISDLSDLLSINQDKEVMRFFPSLLDETQSIEFIERMQKQFEKNGFCYFVAEWLATHEFVGMIGLSEQNYEAPFTPYVDIGWRLKPAFWHMGLATEGAKSCLKYGFQDIQLSKIFSVAPVINTPSIHVMKKIGMEWQYNFDHSKLLSDNRLKSCVLYEIKKEDFR